jgi:hypothetical protein
MYEHITPPHQRQKDFLLRSLIGSLAVGIPSLFVVVHLMKTTPVLAQPSLASLIILVMTLGNFVALTGLEKYRDMLGRLTIHALVSTIGVVLLFVISDALNRFAFDIGHRWMFPMVMTGLVVLYIALFRERVIWVKTLLAVDGIMVAVLWCLAASDKLYMPF